MTAIERYRRPILFYSLATAIPWGLWLGAAWFSHKPRPTPTLELAVSVLGLAGVAAPMAVAFALISADKTLRADVAQRFLNFSAAKPVYWLIACCLMPASILAAIAISLLFGYDAGQFRIARHASFTAGAVSPWVVLVLVPVIEELAWHSYGTDALRSRFTLFTTCLIFSAFWGPWHAPAALIQGFYHANLVRQSAWDALNFLLSIFPFVFLMNWLYYRAARNVWIAVVFHITAGFFNEFFSPHPDTKIIQTALLIVVTVAVVARNRGLFFDKRAAVG